MNTPFVVEDTNLSLAWCRVLKQITDNPGKEITPLVLTLTEFDEVQSMREGLDLHLQEAGFDSISTVSETIFPQSLYQISQFDKTLLYKKYNKNISRIKLADYRNANGTYFERLIAYKGVEKNSSSINQLEIIISSLRQEDAVRRRSKLQASIFNPLTDHKTGVFQGFPCLQHVTFYKSDSGGLIINSFYAVQYLYQRAYGNWLGLINLGKFVAAEANLKLERFNCFVGVETLDHLNKKQAVDFLKTIHLLHSILQITLRQFWQLINEPNFSYSSSTSKDDRSLR